MAYAINRAYGSAVRRNRLRRRLRALISEIDRNDPLPPGMMVIGARTSGNDELTFDQIRRDLTQLIERVRTTNARACNA